MSTNTTNLSLKKPAYADPADIQDINDNMDIVDTAINALEDGMAIVSNNNTHPAISAGQFVYVRKHGSLAEGLYTANSAISANATLSSSNLTADTSGGLNALQSQVGEKAGHIYLTSSDTTWAAIWAKISQMTPGDTDTFYSNGNASTVWSKGAYTGTTYGTITRLSTTSFVLSYATGITGLNGWISSFSNATSSAWDFYNDRMGKFVRIGGSDTVATIYEKLTAVAEYETALFTSTSGTSSSILTSGNIESVLSGIVYRGSGSTFKFICIYGSGANEMIVFTIVDISSTSMGTYTSREYEYHIYNYHIGNFTSLSELQTALINYGVTELTSTSAFAAPISIKYTGSEIDGYPSGYSAPGMMYRIGSDIFAVELYSSAADRIIHAFYYSGTWKWSSTPCQSTLRLTATDTTWADIWEKIDRIRTGESVTIYAQPDPASVLTGGALSNTYLYGVFSRTSSNQFEFSGKRGSTTPITFRITNASASSSGTFSYNDMAWLNSFKMFDPGNSVAINSYKTYTVANSTKAIIYTYNSEMTETMVNVTSSGAVTFKKVASGTIVNITSPSANTIKIENSSGSYTTLIRAIIFAGSMAEQTT